MTPIASTISGPAGHVFLCISDIFRRDAVKFGGKNSMPHRYIFAFFRKFSVN